MILNGSTLPNAQWGYKTTIGMPLGVSKLSNGKISLFDNGQAYDTYSCKCKFVFTEAEMNTFYDIYNDTKRGQSVKLQAGSGFYPFSIAVTEPAGGYDVYIDEIKSKGNTDLFAEFFEVECVFHWAYSSITWNALDPTYCRQGSLNFAGYDYIPYSQYKPKQSVSVAVQRTHGGNIYGFSNPNDLEMNETSFTLTLRDKIANNIVNRIINTYRAQNISMTGAENYFIFTLSEGDETAFNVKLSSGKFEIKHKAHETHEIDFNLVKV